MEHQFEKHVDCKRSHCMICDGGLQFCTGDVELLEAAGVPERHG